MEKKNFALALNQGIRMLSRQNLSKKEFRQKLGKSFDKHIVDAVLLHCEERGYLNEDERAMQVLRSSLRSGHGSLRIQKELAKRGIPENIGKKVLENAFIEKTDHLENVAHKKLSSLSETDPRKRKAKLYRFLLSKGFSSSDIMDFFRKSEALFQKDHEDL